MGADFEELETHLRESAQSADKNFSDGEGRLLCFDD
jgi:hypothetical protein